MASQKRMTLSRLKALPIPERGQHDHFDAAEPGFAVRVSSKGTRSFVVFYRFDGKLRRDTIGQADLTAKDGEVGSIGWARTKAKRRRTQANHGVDPRALDEAERRDRARSSAQTYAATVEKFIELHAKAKKGNRTWPEQKRILLATEPKWHVRPVSKIDREEIQGALDALMTAGKRYAANRAYAALKTFFRWCVRRGYVPNHPMETIDRPFEGEAPRDRHYNGDEVKALWEAADKLAEGSRKKVANRGKTVRDDLTDEFRAAFLKVLMLTGVRRGELAGMKWSEIDDDWLWTIPPERFKSSRPNRPRSHSVPLPKLARRILESLPRIEGEDLVFPSRRAGKAMSGWTLFQKEVSKAAGVADFSFHPVRHTVRTGLSVLGYPVHVKNAVLGHVEPGTGAKYDHHEYVDEKREALDTWADHVAKVVWGENVEALRG